MSVFIGFQFTEMMNEASARTTVSVQTVHLSGRQGIVERFVHLMEFSDALVNFSNLRTVLLARDQQLVVEYLLHTGNARACPIA